MSMVLTGGGALWSRKDAQMQDDVEKIRYAIIANAPLFTAPRAAILFPLERVRRQGRVYDFGYRTLALAPLYSK